MKDHCLNFCFLTELRSSQVAWMKSRGRGHLNLQSLIFTERFQAKGSPIARPVPSVNERPLQLKLNAEESN